MFTFQRGDESISMRPEGTAGAARAYVQHAIHGKEPVSRWFYLGPMYRAERPQRGRYRQFYQAGCEIYGDSGPYADAEMIHMLVGLLTELGISDLKVFVNSLGGQEARATYRQNLLDYLRPRASELSETSQGRLETNPLRVLDSKAPQDQTIAAGAPSVLDSLTDEDRAHWKGLTDCLDALGTPYEVDPRLVRGLDYYTRTSFEIRSELGSLGSQNTLCGGGRYDNMIHELGGPETPAIGFAMGLERILLALPERDEAPKPFCFIAPLGDAAAREGLVLAEEIRRQGYRVELDGRGNSLKSQLRRANSMNATVCAVLGEQEIERGEVQLKLLARHDQKTVARSEAASAIVSELGGST
jgi:histidyl-tRNA synthetase